MADAPTQTALGLAASYRSGDTTPTDVVEHYLARIAESSDRVGAFVTVTADSALAAAKAATDRYAVGEPLPPLFGVPTAIKDLNLTAGVRTMFGSLTTKDFVPAVSDEVVLRIEAAGMISLGKTNTPEFGSPCYTEPDVAPPARTPYDLERSAGGSSGGAGAAVSSGLVPVAQGSDGGGSIRIPASVCGLVGFKPSRGRISRAPIYGDITGLSTAGPLALTVRDAAALLDAMAGHRPGDAMWAAELPAGESYLGWCDRPRQHLRIARFADPAIASAEVDPQVRQAYDDAGALLQRLGHEVVDVEVPMATDIVATFETVWAVSSTLWPLAPGADRLVRPLTRWLRDRGEATSAPDFGAALVAMNQAAAQALEALSGFDAVLTPTLAQLPAMVGGIRNDDDPAADFEAQKAFTPFTSTWNITGMPAVSLPTAWSREGLPIGVMLGGRPGEDHLLFALAQQIEDELSDPGHPWRRPPTDL
ncbi:MAG: amidase [Nocardioidaceae bacterium]